MSFIACLCPVSNGQARAGENAAEPTHTAELLFYVFALQQQTSLQKYERMQMNENDVAEDDDGDDDQ